ncbi:MAG TPA: hypothetical protein VN958_09520 [Chitinophagaceae bacterium]|nr:hypothetical protein [Chitinophagaceae bacterium]
MVINRPQKDNQICPVVFTTAYDEYALRAFKVNGVDYLLKPVDDEELKNGLTGDFLMCFCKNKKTVAMRLQQS